MDWNAVFRNAWKLAACLLIPLVVIGLVLIFRSTTRSSKSLHISGSEQSSVDVLKLWPNARVTYTIDPQLDMARGLIKKAINGIEEGTCIRFIEKALTNDPNWINFIHDDSDCVYPEMVGMTPAARRGQEIIVSGDCLSSGQIQRHLGLALGLGFEETRPDRHKYIRYNPNLPGCNEEVNNTSTEMAKKHHPAAAALFFDYVSHMFVDTKCFQPVGTSTPSPEMGKKLKDEQLVTLNLGSSEDENAGTLSVLDIDKLNAIYKCSGCQSYRFRAMTEVADQSEPFESFHPVLGGNDVGNSPRYICRVYHHGSLLIGKAKVDAHENICWIADPIENKEFVFRKNFEILTNPAKVNLTWTQVNPNIPFPNNTITGGRTATRRPITVGRCRLTAREHTTLIPGSVLPRSTSMSVGFGHQAYNCSPFEVLVCADQQ